MGGAPPSSAPSYRVAAQEVAVPGADATGPALVHEVASVGTAPGRHLEKRGPQMAVEAPDLGRRERARRPSGRQSGPPQDLVGDQVTDTSDASLVHEPGFEGRPAPGQGAGQLAERDTGRVVTQSRFRRVQLDSAQPTRVTNAQMAPVREGDPETVIPFQGLVAGISQASDPGSTVHKQPTAHAEAQTEDRAGGALRSRRLQR